MGERGAVQPSPNRPVMTGAGLDQDAGKSIEGRTVISRSRRHGRPQCARSGRSLMAQRTCHIRPFATLPPRTWYWKIAPGTVFPGDNDCSNACSVACLGWICTRDDRNSKLPKNDTEAANRAWYSRNIASTREAQITQTCLSHTHGAQQLGTSA